MHVFFYICVYIFVYAYVLIWSYPLLFDICYSEEKSLYAILNLEKGATPEEIKKSYRKVKIDIIVVIIQPLYLYKCLCICVHQSIMYINFHGSSKLLLKL